MPQAATDSNDRYSQETDSNDMDSHYTNISADCHAGIDRFMWGSDYPHDEGTMPYTREHLRQIFSGAPEAEMRKILGGNAATVYGFDLDKLAPLASKVGPTVGEIATPLDVLPDPPNEALLKGVDA